jgi:hypothetical protein
MIVFFRSGEDRPFHAQQSAVVPPSGATVRLPSISDPGYQDWRVEEVLYTFDQPHLPLTAANRLLGLTDDFIGMFYDFVHLHVSLI